MRGLLQRFQAVLNSRRFFWATIAFFVFEAAWIGLSAAYPQAFDESFHFGIIKVYSHYWLPFLNSQPPHADAYGAVFRDPSYLYHYTMSFPYRLIAHFVHSQTIQIIILRFINIAFATVGLIVFRRVLLRARVSKSFTNLSIALFILIPIVPQLAGQINYDNLLFPLVAWTCLLTMEVVDEFKKHEPSIYTLLTLATLCTFATMVKYEFLPIYLGIVLFLAYTLYRNFHGNWRSIWTPLRKSWTKKSGFVQIVLIVLLLFSVGLFVRRDGVNLVKYHSFTPDCAKVMSVKACSAYGPWDYSYHQHQWVRGQKVAGKAVHFDSPIVYTIWWAYWLWYRSFFAVDGPGHDYRNYPPLPLPTAAAGVLGIASVFVILIALLRKRLFGSNPYLSLFCMIIVIYMAALWVEGYLQYHKTDVMVLMNGRYILPVLLPFAAVVSQAASPLLRHLPKLKVTLVVVALLCFVEGGGVLTFIMRSNPNWDWPNSAAIHVNNGARNVLRPVIIEGDKTYGTHVWFFN